MGSLDEKKEKKAEIEMETNWREGSEMAFSCLSPAAETDLERIVHGFGMSIVDSQREIIDFYEAKHHSYLSLYLRCWGSRFAGR